MANNSRLDMLNSIKRRLGRWNDDTVDADMNAEIINTQEHILEAEEELPWFLLSRRADANLIAQDERIPIPTDFLMEYEEGSLWIDAANDGVEFTKLVKADYDEIRRKYPAEGTYETPKAYALVGNVFRVRPIPDVAYPLQMVYYQREPELSSDTSTNQWTTYAYNWFMNEAGFAIADMLRDDRAAQFFRARADTARAKFMATNEARVQANFNQTMGD